MLDHAGPPRGIAVEPDAVREDHLVAGPVVERAALCDGLAESPRVAGVECLAGDAIRAAAALRVDAEAVLAELGLDAEAVTVAVVVGHGALSGPPPEGRP